MDAYLDLLRKIRAEGRPRRDRTGTGTIGIFGAQMRFNLADGFPLVTTKRVHFHSVLHELLWFISGDTNTKYLNDNGVKIWDDWATRPHELTLEERAAMWQHKVNNHAPLESTHEDMDKLGIPRRAGGGDLGPVYGKQWRDWGSVQESGKISLKTRVIMHIEKNEYATQEVMHLKHERARHPGGEHDVPKHHYAEACDAGGIPRRFTERVRVDQLVNLMYNLKNDPFSRRHLVTAWNPGELHLMALPPCHCLFQFYVEVMTDDERIMWWRNNETASYTEYGYALIRSAHDYRRDQAMRICPAPKLRLSCQLYQRSADMFLGVPFNIASYALLTTMIAHCLNYAPGDFIHSIGDAHIYSNHLEQVDLQLTRQPRELPRIVINPQARDLFTMKADDIKLVGYDPYTTIKAPVAV